MNRFDQSVDWLEHAADSGFPNYTLFDIDPNLDPIRENPRFIDFMSQLKRQWLLFKDIAASSPN